MTKTATNTYEKHPALINGMSAGGASLVIVWLFSLGGIAIPAGAAAFIAGISVPIIEALINKLLRWLNK